MIVSRVRIVPSELDRFCCFLKSIENGRDSRPESDCSLSKVYAKYIIRKVKIIQRREFVFIAKAEVRENAEKSRKSGIFPQKAEEMATLRKSH